MAIIVGVALFKLVDFKNFHVEKPALAVIYLVCFIFSLWIIFKKPKASSSDQPKG